MTRQKIDLWDLVVWTVLRQRATDDNVGLHTVELHALAAAQGWEPRGSTLDGTATLERRAGLGCAIDGGPVRGVAPQTHPDAEAVSDAINRLPARSRAAILCAARTGEAPGWIDPRWQRLVSLPARSGAGRGVRYRVDAAWEDTPERSVIARLYLSQGLPILDRHGRSVLEREERAFTFRRAEDGKRQLRVRWCPVEPSPSDDVIAWTNSLYADWHAGMMALLGELLDVRLRDHAITGFAAAARSWEA